VIFAKTTKKHKKAKIISGLLPECQKTHEISPVCSCVPKTAKEQWCSDRNGNSVPENASK